MNASVLKAHEFAAYCKRLGVESPGTADFAALETLHRAHITSIPFENIDVQMGKRPPREIDDVFDKLVTNARGGWCYEMNLLFHAALASLGFKVRRVMCSISRNGERPEQCGDHLALLVRVDDETYLADVGFGGSLRTPVPLRKLETQDGPFTITIEQAGRDRWRYDEAVGDAVPFGYEFNASIIDESQIAAMEVAQAIEDWSPFVKNLVAQRRTEHTHFALRGKVFTRTDSQGFKKTTLDSEKEFARTLLGFGLEVETAALWEKVEARHRELFGVGG